MKITKTKLMWVGFAVLLVVFLFSWSKIFPSRAGKPILNLDPNTLPGIMTSDAPWSVEIRDLPQRLAAIGLPILSAEGSALHIHQHIDIFVNGSQVAIPAGIGIDQAAGFISPIHTHDGSGVIHIESPTERDFTLGEFFDVWGVRFTSTTLGGYVATNTSTLTVYANGSPVPDDPRNLVLAPHEEIAVVYGSMGTSTVPSSYNFGAGL